MRHIFYLSTYKLPLKSLLSIFFIFMIFSGFNADAQHRKDPWATFGGGGGGGSSDSGYGISLSADYDSPTGPLGNIFNPAPAIDLGVVRYLGNFTFNATLGYRTYSPKQAVFYYDDGAGGTGTVVYQNYPVFSVYLGA